MIRYVVSQDGTGDFSSVQAAVDAVKAGEKAEIFVRPGLYRERVAICRDGLILRGGDAESTVIAWSACAKDLFPDGREKGTFLSFTMLIAARDVTVEGITVRNDAGDGRIAGQAVALYAAGDRGLFRNCRFLACQDTLFCGPVMPKVLEEISPRKAGTVTCVPSVGDCPVTEERLYFERCLIRGDVDFIFGPYRCWFEACVLQMNARGGWYAAPNTPEGQPWGFVFHRCRLTGACPEGRAYLGRPWRKGAAALYMRCEMAACVSPAGFADWDENRVVTERLGEWRTQGARADTTFRHPGERIWTNDGGAPVTREEVLNGWRPGEEAGLREGDGMTEKINAFIRRYLDRYQDYKTYWNYEDGCVLLGCIDLYRVTGDPMCRDFVLRYLERRVTPDGAVPSYPEDKYNIDSTNCGKALFFALDETGDPRYRKAADYIAQRLITHPRCSCGNFWHKEIYPEQIWLDGLYMAQPFRAEYDRRFGGGKDAGDIAAQFQNVRKYLYDDKKKLYYHACDLAKKQPWANPETGKSPNFWLRSMGWYLMALIDCIDLMNEQLYEHYRALIDLFREAVPGILRWADPETGLYYQVIDRADAPGNYLETSGSAMVIYSILKGVRLGVLDREKYLTYAKAAMERLTKEKLVRDAEGIYHLEGICAVAGLGPGNKRDGSVAYYLSEPVVADDAKGVGPYFMALSEYWRA